MQYPHPAWIEIDLQQLKKNIAAIRKRIGKSLYCLPVKANAYGHGLCIVGKTAEEAGVDYLAVAHLQEGIELRQAGIQIPILVLGAIHEDQIPDLIHFNLEFTISSKFKADLVTSTLGVSPSESMIFSRNSAFLPLGIWPSDIPSGQKCGISSKTSIDSEERNPKLRLAAKKTHHKVRVHLEVDTGMHRTGVRVATAKDLFQHLLSLNCFEVVGIYSHLATTDHFALHQIESFHSLLQDPVFQSKSLISHIANSGGTVHFSQSHLKMVRPSFLTFGYGPDVTPCFSLKAKVSYFKVVGAGVGIGYGHTHVTKKQTRIVTIPVGYGDGYRRALSNRGSVLIRGKRFPIVGTICMDQFMVDVGDHEIYVGDEVVLIGKQGSEEISLLEIAELCDTIPYEILCLFNDRIPRIYN